MGNNFISLITLLISISNLKCILKKIILQPKERFVFLPLLYELCRGEAEVRIKNRESINYYFSFLICYYSVSMKMRMIMRMKVTMIMMVVMMWLQWVMM